MTGIEGLIPEMGTISPNPHYSGEMARRCMKEIFQPTIDAMREEGRPFQGCLYFGLMLTQDGPKVIEYNSRFGDPETQVVLPRLKTDLVEILEACIDGTLKELDIQWSDEAAAVWLWPAAVIQNLSQGY